jgi:CheY-like chemotaxis protein
MGQGLSKRRTVLIVEDDLDLRRLTTTLLEDEQFTSPLKWSLNGE